ncbi:MAG: hypothetical protein JST86_16705 [Bacteroidetes bacterium]|nr:hypothetical protein [Bacteroidota bacterium]
MMHRIPSVNKRTVPFCIALGLFLLCSSTIHAQKVFPVKQSGVSGIAVPDGTKQDKRLLMTVSSNVMLNDIAKKSNAAIQTTEILYTPPSFTIDSFLTAVKTAGWNVTADNTDQHAYWLEQNGKYLLAYFASKKSQGEIYTAACTQPPSLNGGGTTSNTTTVTNTTNNNTQQTNTVTQDNNPPPAQGNNTQGNNTNNSTPAINSSFAFNTTNFDDGWTSTVQEDWVEVTKGNVKVLLHYPKDGTIIPADPGPEVVNAWNILVAPHYRNLQNFHTAYVNDYNMVYIGSGTVDEATSGKNVYAVLFRRGSSGWIEIVTPDKNAFIQEFKFDPETIRWDSEISLFALLEKMPGYNKFAIAAADFNGKWTSDFSGIQQMYNVYTGAYAGMHVNQSNEYFIFSGNTYSWKLQVVSGMAGSSQFNKAESKGTFSVPNNWQLYCSKIEKGPKTFHAFWSCIKGARVLNLLDAVYPGSGSYTRYGLAK